MAIITDKIRADETVTTTDSNVYEREQNAYERGIAHPLEVEWEAEEAQEKFYGN